MRSRSLSLRNSELHRGNSVIGNIVPKLTLLQLIIALYFRPVNSFSVFGGIFRVFHTPAQNSRLVFVHSVYNKRYWRIKYFIQFISQILLWIYYISNDPGCKHIFRSFFQVGTSQNDPLKGVQNPYDPGSILPAEYIHSLSR